MLETSLGAGRTVVPTLELHQDMSVEHLIAPTHRRAGDVLVRELSAGGWSRLTAIVAFARLSGVRHVEEPLRSFIAGGGCVDLTLGVDMLGTSYEAAWYLMHAVAPRGRLLLASAEPGATFHPKIFILSDASAEDPDAVRALRAASRALVVIGSSNLTGGGLYANDEAGIAWRPDLSRTEDASAWSALAGQLAPWLTAGDPAIECSATPSQLVALGRAGRLPQELSLIARGGAAAGGSKPRPRGAGSRRRRKPPRISGGLAGPPPPPLGPRSTVSPPGLNVLIARLSFGGSRRWPQWELNTEILSSFFGIAVKGETISREAVERSGGRSAPESTPLVIGPGKNRRLEFPEPDGRLDPTPYPALLVVVDRRPRPFRYAVLLPQDHEYQAVEALNLTSAPVGPHVAATKRVVVPHAALAAIWPNCPL
jgi:hypothetical protein